MPFLCLTDNYSIIFRITGSNNFVGTIPVELDALTNLQYFSIEGNPFLSGDINELFCDTTNKTRISSDYVHLEYIWSDCLRPDVICDCCTECHDTWQ